MKLLLLQSLIFAASAAASGSVTNPGELLRKLIEFLKPLYDWLYHMFYSYWTWVASGSVSDVILKVCIVALLSLGIAWASGAVARLVQYLIYGVCIVIVLLGAVAVAAKLGLIHMALPT